MEPDDPPLLHEPDLMLAVLRVAAARSATLDACVDHLRTLRACARVEELVPEDEVRSRLRAVTAKLDRASLIERAAANGFRITARGRKVLSDHPDGVDESVLQQFEEIRAAGRRDEAHHVPQPARSEYEAGYEAYGEGYGLADNPHPLDARGHLDWQNGWSQARDEAARRRR
jgi:restriction system protein